MSRTSVHVPDLDAVEWKPLAEFEPGLPKAPFAIDARLLNRDPDTGASTLMLRLPPGATDQRRGTRSCDYELFLVDGDLTLDGETHDAFAYWHLPAGTVHGAVTTEAGATLIATTTGPLDYVETPDSQAPPVQGLDVDSLPWQATSDQRENYTYTGPESRLLHGDPEVGAYSAMARIPRGYVHPDLGFHQHTQEQVLLQGSVNETGVERHARSYWCHPPGEIHGKSFTTDEEAISFIRFDGPWEITVVDGT